MGIFQKVLLAFGIIALFVGAFVIANTLSITIAQRMREFATLRTLGASRRQVLRTVMVEALVIGLLASVIGLFLGLGIAKGLNALFAAIGVNFPAGGTVFAARTIVVSIVDRCRRDAGSRASVPRSRRLAFHRLRRFAKVQLCRPPVSLASGRSSRS